MSGLYKSYKCNGAVLAGLAVFVLCGGVSRADSAGAGILARSYEGGAQIDIIGRSAHGEPRPVRGRAAVVAPVVAAAKKNAIGVEAYAQLIEQYSASHALDPNLVKALIQVESGGNPNAVSPKGAAGLMQLMPETAAELGVSDRFDPEQNIASGTLYLRGLMNQFKSTEVALWAYNAGPQAVRQGRMPLETQEYVPKVLRLRRVFASAEVR
jgi:soluble lytic murein transglycosylase-like protein